VSRVTASLLKTLLITGVGVEKGSGTGIILGFEQVGTGWGFALGQEPLGGWGKDWIRCFSKEAN
jgi:hypothetical protein